MLIIKILSKNRLLLTEKFSHFHYNSNIFTFFVVYLKINNFLCAVKILYIFRMVTPTFVFLNRFLC